MNDHYDPQTWKHWPHEREEPDVAPELYELLKAYSSVIKRKAA